MLQPQATAPILITIFTWRICTSHLILTKDYDEEPGSEKRRRQVFREDVSPLLGGKIPSAAFDWARLMFNNLDSRGISIPDGIMPSSDRNSDGRSDEKRLILFSGDSTSPDIPSTYTLRSPVEYPLFPNPDEKPLPNDDYDCPDRCSDSLDPDPPPDPDLDPTLWRDTGPPPPQQYFLNDETKTYSHSENFPHQKESSVMIVKDVRQKPSVMRNWPKLGYKTPHLIRTISTYSGGTNGNNIREMSPFFFPQIMRTMLSPNPVYLIISTSPLLKERKVRRSVVRTKFDLWSVKSLLQNLF